MTASAPTQPSSMCRNDEHTLCKSVRARCNCTCHKGAQMPPTTASRRDTDDRPRAVQPVPDAPQTILTTVVFEDPPARFFGRKPAKEQLALELEAVAARPGEWARIARFESKSSAGSKATALRKNPPKGRWEFRGVTQDGASYLYVRYLGD